MNIHWQYLDKRAGTIKAMADYPDMLYIYETTGEHLSEAIDAMLTTGSNIPRPTPATHNPRAGESRLIHHLDRMDAIEERYQQAAEFIAWFQPAWNQLSDKQKYLLTKFFMNRNEDGIGAVEEVCERFHVERTTAHRQKIMALDRLSRLLFGH